MESNEYTEALDDIADALDLPTGATPEDIVRSARNQWAKGIHSCSHKCARPNCVLRRRVAELEGEMERQRNKWKKDSMRGFVLEFDLRWWQKMNPAEMRLRCGELSAQEIRTIHSVLNQILPPENAEG